jgi:para-aminobenzoate synthetase component 1
MSRTITCTIADILHRLGPSEQHVCVLHGTDNDGWGSLVAWNPVATFHTRMSHSLSQTSESCLNFVHQQSRLQRHLIGFISYEYGVAAHGIMPQTVDDLAIPDIYVLSFDHVLQFDQSGTITLASEDYFFKSIDEILRRPIRSDASRTVYTSRLKPTQSRSTYERSFATIKAYISAGDLYQINLTHRMEGTTSANSRSIFAKVTQHSQANFQAYIEAENFEVMSASPERFMRVADQIIETFPIKGTRPRSSDHRKDMAMKIELETSEKEITELSMIIDLMRNDLGAVCEIGSVQVIKPRQINGYATVWHAQAHLSGKLPPAMDAISAFLAMLPGGSVTGCPKIRAMEIIDQLEKTRRGVYSGSIFVMRPDGTFDSSIAIRTLIKQKHNLYLSVGGGIVYDSTVASEYQETLDKAAFFLNLEA